MAYLKEFASSHNLEAKQDRAGNLLITAGDPGQGGSAHVILQSHVDMVCEKNSDVQHDFDNDPIETVIEGIGSSQGTTLGADNGIGVAAQLARVGAKDLSREDRSTLHGGRGDRQPAPTRWKKGSDR